MEVYELRLMPSVSVLAHLYKNGLFKKQKVSKETL